MKKMNTNAFMPLFIKKKKLKCMCGTDRNLSYYSQKKVTPVGGDKQVSD